MINELIERNLLEAERGRGSWGAPKRMWPSMAFGCLRRTVLQLEGYQSTIDTAPNVLQAMRYGVLYEDDIVAAVRAQLGAERVTTQLRLSDEYWSGKADLVLDHGTPDVTIVECKAVNSKWWNYNDSLPKVEHVGQLCLYGRLYVKEYGGVMPRLILFYRSWSDHAEYTIEPHGDTVIVHGTNNGEPVRKVLALNVRARREAAEWHFNNRQPLPARLTNKEDGCTFRGRPSCPMYYHCWQEEQPGSSS